jgi:hypothetical protein
MGSIWKPLMYVKGKLTHNARDILSAAVGVFLPIQNLLRLFLRSHPAKAEKYFLTGMIAFIYTNYQGS